MVTTATKAMCLKLPVNDYEKLTAIAEKRRTTAPALVREAIGRALDSGLLA